MRGHDLIGLALRTVGAITEGDWPMVRTLAVAGRALEVEAPWGPGLTIGTESALATTNASAVASLSRIGTDERRADDRHVEAWLVDSDDPDAHNDLAYALHDVADATQELLTAGETVFLHCVRAEHRTPSVALLHAVKYGGLEVDEAAAAIRNLLGHNTIGGLLWSTAMKEVRNAQ